VHEPAVVAKHAADFDASVVQTWQTLSQCDKPDDITRAFAALPVKRGGLGFTPMVEIMGGAYASSRDAALRTSQDGVLLSQKANSALTFDRLAEIIDADPHPKRHREHNSMPGTASLFTMPEMRTSCSAFSAALRHRLFAPVAGLPNELFCPGCNHAAFTGPDAKRSFMRHAPNCASVQGRNASSRHADLKMALKKILADCLVPFASAEPRHCHSIKCSGCAETMKVDLYDAHAKQCEGLKAKPLTTQPRTTGPDIEVYLPTDNADTLLVDVTVVGAETDTHSASELSDVFAAAEKRKKESYERFLPDGSKLVVFGVTDSGALSAPAKSFINRVAANSTTATVAQCCRRISAAVLHAHGAALKNAEALVGVKVVHGAFLPPAVARRALTFGESPPTVPPAAPAFTPAVSPVTAAVAASTPDGVEHRGRTNSPARATPVSLFPTSGAQDGAIIATAPSAQAPTTTVIPAADAAASASAQGSAPTAIFRERPTTPPPSSFQHQPPATPPPPPPFQTQMPASPLDTLLDDPQRFANLVSKDGSILGFAMDAKAFSVPCDAVRMLVNAEQPNMCVRVVRLAILTLAHGHRTGRDLADVSSVYACEDSIARAVDVLELEDNGEGSYLCGLLIATLATIGAITPGATHFSRQQIDRLLLLAGVIPAADVNNINTNNNNGRWAPSAPSNTATAKQRPQLRDWFSARATVTELLVDTECFWRMMPKDGTICGHRVDGSFFVNPRRASMQCCDAHQLHPLSTDVTRVLRLAVKSLARWPRPAVYTVHPREVCSTVVSLATESLAKTGLVIRDDESVRCRGLLAGILATIGAVTTDAGSFTEAQLNRIQIYANAVSISSALKPLPSPENFGGNRSDSGDDDGAGERGRR
jgi:hypothetical protein